MKGTRPLDNTEIRKVSISRDFRMSVKYLFSTLAILLATLTFFALDTFADTESAYDVSVIILCGLLGTLLLVLGFIVLARKKRHRPFLKEHRSLLTSDDPKVLLELVEKCNEYRDRRNIPEVASLAWQAKDKATKIQQAKKDKATKIQQAKKDKATKIQQAKEETERIQRKIANLETFKSEISEDGSHPSVVATLKETMHNPDSFQHVSSDYETVEQEGKSYQKIVMTFRGRNTFNALVLQTCYFLVDEDNQITLVGSPDSTESSPVNTVSLAAAADTAVSAVDGAATLVDLLAFFTSDEE